MPEEGLESYIARILGYLGGRDPFRVLRATPGMLAKRISGAPRRRLTTPPARGKWSVGQILAHLSEIELLWGYRIRTILETDGVAIVGMDQNAWAENSRYERLDPGRSLETFRTLRRRNLELITALSPRALRRHGLHSQFGKLSISRIARLLAGHDLNHTLQVDAILRKDSSPSLRSGACLRHRAAARPDADSTASLAPSLRSGSRNASRFARPDSRNLVALRTDDPSWP